MIVEVIVDVAAYPIDRPFDYVVPEHLEDLVERGSRVHVPFGNRKVQGFITNIKGETDIDRTKLKEVLSIIDVEPVITEELLELSKWMTKKTLCYEIDALQVMLPAALRASYKKNIKIVDSTQLEEEILALFGKKEVLPYEAFEKAGMLRVMKRHLTEGSLLLENIIKQQTRVKTVTKYTLVEDKEFIIDQLNKLTKQAVKQKELIEWLLAQEQNSFTMQEIIQTAAVSNATVHALINKKILVKEQEEVYREVTSLDYQDRDNRVQLTNEQTAALSKITNAQNNRENTTFLLHGITGSGKTEIYLHAIEKSIAEGKQAIMLVPEISLTPQMTRRFKLRFGDQVAVMHSGLSTGEKFDEWRKIWRGEVMVVVGARSAVFAPFKDLGVIILDEEHESSYKQEDTPRYHARDVAIWRSEYHKCPVILGSATPSLESYARASKGVYTLLTLTMRAKEQALPTVNIVDMRAELKSGNRSMFSVPLADAIREKLEKKEQIVLFLNKRGFSSFVLCRDCGTVVECDQCDISLTYHREGERLKCHYCGHEEPVPHQCPECQSEHIRFFGTGTQKVEEEITKLFPYARVLRMDVDTTRTKGSHERILKQFGDGEADILLGTQMIAKGLDFPNITLVGVLNADTTLHLADFRAAEKTFQLMTQVSGRAGRHDKEGIVFIQTYTPEHYAIEYSKDQLYEPFYHNEMIMRKQYEYPPFYYVTLVQVTHENVLLAAEYAKLATDWLRGNLSSSSMVIGPTASAISKIQNRYRYQCLIKYKQEPLLIEKLQQLIKIYRTEWIKKGVILTVDLDPSTIL
ncbi:primosomal protein N' [Psychrobacillus sp. BL-248-WT-3]|uniref:primosomal protein N' n=1 Tax=Psychrobacillus sp. BL-248-WT-3 TaxID=2725306 RepID=UPI00146B4B7E|nr:primosomal protein N' [Psychrobacillus sp. BL-248-WT-3]NME04786.1 primosomal protein N' [Psychrobacillus sp. BL-248-WT-3]